MMPRKTISLGWHTVGPYKVRVNYDPKRSGGEFTTHSITIGGASKDWHCVVAIALHEALEHAYADIQARYVPSYDAAHASDGFLFVANHDQFSEAVARAAHFLADVLPEISRACKACK